MENNKETNKQSIGEGLLLLSFILIMSGLGFADSDKTAISKNEVIGMYISGTGFLIIILMLVYFAYTSIKDK